MPDVWDGLNKRTYLHAMGYSLHVCMYYCQSVETELEKGYRSSVGTTYASASTFAFIRNSGVLRFDRK